MVRAKGNMPRPDGNGGKTQTVLQVERQHGHHHLSATGVGEHAQQRADEARMTEQLQIDHRSLLQAFDHHEQPQQQGAAHDRV